MKTKRIGSSMLFDDSCETDSAVVYIRDKTQLFKRKRCIENVVSEKELEKK